MDSQAKCKVTLLLCVCVYVMTDCENKFPYGTIKAIYLVCLCRSGPGWSLGLL